MASVSNIYVDQGTVYSSVINMTNDDGTTFDLTNYSAIAQIKKTYNSVVSAAFNTAISIPNATVTISLTRTQSAALAAGRYVYDLLIYNATGNAVRVVEGILVINPAVSVAP